MKFLNWLRLQNAVELSEKINLSPFSVWRWRNAERTPEYETMVKLVKLGEGAFGYEDILKDTHKKRIK